MALLLMLYASQSESKQRKTLWCLEVTTKVGHAAFFCKLYPLLRIKINRVERTRKLFHFAVQGWQRRTGSIHRSRRAYGALCTHQRAWNRVRVDHHAVFRFAKPFDVFMPFLHGCRQNCAAVLPPLRIFCVLL